MPRQLPELSGKSPHQINLWGETDLALTTEFSLVATAYSLCLGCGTTPSKSDDRLWAAFGKPQFVGDITLSFLASQITQGMDPLGEAFCSVRTSEARRRQGATYTPQIIVDAMIAWAKIQELPARVIDPGCGSARFLTAAGRAFPSSELIGIENDPLAALIARANLAASGLIERARILNMDYRHFDERISGRSLYVGNPPYVRHHKIEARWKEWLVREAAKLNHPVSALAGLHVYFILATAINSKPGDIGAFITASEWLDVNYGLLARKLFLRELGGASITVIEPTAQPFPDAATTAAVMTFNIGAKPTSCFFRRVGNLQGLSNIGSGRKVHRERLEASRRWSYLSQNGDKPANGFVELGDICRVHRGQVTGANGIWIAGEHSAGLPHSVLFHSITRAREVIAAAGMLDDSASLRKIIDLPVELDLLGQEERRLVDGFLKKAKAMGAARGYVASHRKAWWSVGLRSPAPIISTYMARRAPAFVINKIGARHINIAHGLYPIIPLSNLAKSTLVGFLQSNISRRNGRTYSGGLTKFEPREMERLFVPGPEMLAAGLSI